MIIQGSPFTFPVNWTKVLGFGKQVAKNIFKNPVSTFYYCIF